MMRYHQPIAATTILLALLAGCTGETKLPIVNQGNPPTPTPTSTPGPRPSPTATPVASASPTPKATATPTPSPTPTPTPTPTPSPTPIPANVTLQRTQGDLMVTVTDGRLRIANATVTLRDGAGTILGTHTTNSGCQAIFPTTEVQGNATVSVSVDAINNFRQTTCPLATDPTLSNELVVPLSPFGKVSGVVTDSSGTPIYGAVVSDFKNSTMTSQEGIFYLPEVPFNTYSLKARKLHYQIGSRTDLVLGQTTNACGRVSLVADATPVRVLFDGSKAPFGGAYTLSSYYATLKQKLVDQGMQVTMGGNTTLDLTNVDILVIASPSLAYSQVEINTINTWLQGGKKLILLGEWGGYPGFANSALAFTNAGYNLAINLDLVKEFGSTALSNDSAFFVVNNFTPHPITQQVTGLALFRTASVSIPNKFINAPDPNEPQIVATTTANGLQIMAVNSTLGLVGAAVSGLGNVVVIGDSSVWSDVDSQGLVPPSANIFQQNNATFASNVFQW